MDLSAHLDRARQLAAKPPDVPELKLLAGVHLSDGKDCMGAFVLSLHPDTGEPSFFSPLLESLAIVPYARAPQLVQRGTLTWHQPEACPWNR